MSEKPTAPKQILVLNPVRLRDGFQRPDGRYMTNLASKAREDTDVEYVRASDADALEDALEDAVSALECALGGRPDVRQFQESHVKGLAVLKSYRGTKP